MTDKVLVRPTGARHAAWYDPDPTIPIAMPRSGRSAWHWLLVVPVVLPLFTPLYNRMGPSLFGIPFFYWSQLAFSVLSIVVTALVYLATRGRA